jgi:hypothetical protein
MQPSLVNGLPDKIELHLTHMQEFDLLVGNLRGRPLTTIRLGWDRNVVNVLESSFLQEALNKGLVPSQIRLIESVPIPRSNRTRPHPHINRPRIVPIVLTSSRTRARNSLRRHMWRALTDGRLTLNWMSIRGGPSGRALSPLLSHMLLDLSQIRRALCVHSHPLAIRKRHNVIQ